VDSVFPAFVASSVLTIPTGQAPIGNVYYTSTLTTDGARLTTFQLDPVDFTGNLQVQGATAGADTNQEWYNISFEDLKTGNTVEQLDFTRSTERLGINVEGYHPYIRLELGINGGNVDLIQYR
jgi:hypothetical protein